MSVCVGTVMVLSPRLYNTPCLLSQLFSWAINICYMSSHMWRCHFSTVQHTVSSFLSGPHRLLPCWCCCCPSGLYAQPSLLVSLNLQVSAACVCWPSRVYKSFVSQVNLLCSRENGCRFHLESKGEARTLFILSCVWGWLYEPKGKGHSLPFWQQCSYLFRPYTDTPGSALRNFLGIILTHQCNKIFV